MYLQKTFDFWNCTNIISSVNGSSFLIWYQNDKAKYLLKNHFTGFVTHKKVIHTLDHLSKNEKWSVKDQQKDHKGINPATGRERQNHPTTKLQVAKIWTINSCHTFLQRLTNELETLS